MKQGNKPRGRSRGRGGNNGRGRNNGSRNSSIDSNGPSGRVRGSASQVVDKYLSAARDATSQGDRILAENFYQHADHYLRIQNGHKSRESQNNNSGDGRDGNVEEDKKAGQSDSSEKDASIRETA